MSTEERREVKKKLRREVLARRAALTEPERERGNLLITERILGHQWYYLSDTILGFVSYGSEICTTEILENALQDGKRVYVPKVEGQEMRFYRIQSLAELKDPEGQKSAVHRGRGVLPLRAGGTAGVRAGLVLQRRAGRQLQTRAVGVLLVLPGPYFHPRHPYKPPAFPISKKPFS